MTNVLEEAGLSSTTNTRKRLWLAEETEQVPQDIVDTGAKRTRAPRNETSTSVDVSGQHRRIESTCDEVHAAPLFSLDCNQQVPLRPAAKEIRQLSSRDIDNLPHRMAADIRGECVPVTGLAGERVYAEYQRPPFYTEDYSRSMDRGHGVGLLSIPIEMMMEKAEQEKVEKIFAESAMEAAARDHSGDVLAVHEQLWVDKYSPKFFTELLSDEQTNREVLGWLKHWDPCVFGAKRLSTTEDVLAALRLKKPLAKEGVLGKKRIFSTGDNLKSYKNQHSINQISNDSSEPSNSSILMAKANHDAKVLLLCGPPGLGKTTLAHIAAKHCGYRVVEINASDDRVATTLEAKILNAVQMRSVMGDSRPNCLVIDEIDGAIGGNEGKGAIDKLIEIISADKNIIRKDTNSSHFSSKVPKKKGGAAIGRLTRPIICICNDPYTPVLRSLRQIARVHVFGQPTVSRVVTRLKHICNEEGFRTSARALTTLAEHTECDIRSCLNTLQFLKKKGESLKSLDVSSQVIGRKDVTSSIFDIWQEVFQKRKAKKAKIMHDTASDCDQEQKEFNFLSVLIANHGDHDLVMEGIYENLLHMRYFDSSLQKVVACLKLIGDSDIISHQVRSKQLFSLTVYQTFVPIAVRRLVSQPERPHIKWPKSFQRYKTELALKKEILNTWIIRMSTVVARYISVDSLCLDVVSLLLSILSPTLRPVATQLLTPNEVATMNHVVDTMIGYGVTYTQPKLRYFPGSKVDNNVNSQAELVLYPPIDNLVAFKDHRLQHRQLSSTLCQMLGHEVELEKIRRESTGKFASVQIRDLELEVGGNTISRNFYGQKESATFGHPTEASSLTSPSMETFPEIEQLSGCTETDTAAPKLLSANPKSGRKETHQATNFFDRFKKGSKRGSSVDSKTLATNFRDSRPLLYKFHEGFTNAVRRPMLMRDILL